MDRFPAAIASLPRLFDAQYRLLLFVALPLLVIAGLGIRVGFDQASQFQQKLLKNDLELIARAVRIPVGEALTNNDLESVRVALQSIFTIDRVYGVSVFDRDGRRVASGGIAEADLTETSIPRLMEETGEIQEAYRKVEGRTVFSHFLPLFNSRGNSEGFIQITRRPGDLSRPLRQMAWIAWSLWCALAVTITLTVVLGYRRSIGRHVNQLVGVMADVGGGRRDRRAVPAGPREMAAIATGLNEMLDSIESYQREIETRRRSEKDLLTRLKDKERMAAVGDMARGFAHELGAPLSVIDGRASRLQRRGLVGEGGEYELEEIRRQVRHLSDTVTNLLELSRGGTAGDSRFNLGDILSRLESLYAGSGDYEGVAFAIEPPGDCPELTGDPGRLQVAISSLIRNALQAARSRVDLRVFSGESEVRIEVEDDGPGLPEVETARLVEPFFSTRMPGEGTGLGLAITHRIVGEHGGTLEFENRSGGGCRVTIILPRNGDGAPV